MDDQSHTINRIFLLSGVFACLFFGAFFAVSIAEAHKVSAASVLVEIDTEKQDYKVSAAMEVDPSEDQALNEQISPEDAARTFAEEFLTILFDKEEQKPKLIIHTETASDSETPPELQRKQVIVNLTGKLKKDARDFLLYIDANCPMAVVMVFIKDKQPARRMQVVLPGEFSRPFNIEPILEGDPFEKKEEAKKASNAETEAKPVTKGSEAEREGRKELSPFMMGWKSFLGGTFLHFALLAAILLLGLKWRAIALQIVALVIGQSIGLYLINSSVIKAPGWLLPVLALGVIAFAVGAIFRKDMRLSRWFLVPVTGIACIQGMFLYPGGKFAGSDLLAFKSGFCVFQLLCAIIIAALLHFLSQQKWYRSGFVFPAAAILAGYGLYLKIEVLL